MRRLGQELGVAAMSIYNHLSGREELLDGLSEVMVERIGMRFGEAPEDALRRFADGIRAVALAHPQAFQLVGMRPLRTREAFASVEAVLGALRSIGLSDEAAVHAYRALASYARGFALSEIAGFTLQSADDRTRSDGQPAAEPFPNISELEPLLDEPDHEAAFAFGLELLLAGLRAQAPASGVRTTGEQRR